MIEYIEPTTANLIIGGLIALVLVALTFVCAIARKSESCDSERDCSNCGHCSDDGMSEACHECVDHYPLAPNWTPIK